MTRKSSSPMLNSAGIETANEKRRVRIPFADFTNRRMRPIRKTRTTLRSVGETGKFWRCCCSAEAENKKVLLFIVQISVEGKPDKNQ